METLTTTGDTNDNRILISMKNNEETVLYSRLVLHPYLEDLKGQFIYNKYIYTYIEYNNRGV